MAVVAAAFPALHPGYISTPTSWECCKIPPSKLRNSSFPRVRACCLCSAAWGGHGPDFILPAPTCQGSQPSIKARLCLQQATSKLLLLLRPGASRDLKSSHTPVAPRSCCGWQQQQQQRQDWARRERQRHWQGSPAAGVN